MRDTTTTTTRDLMTCPACRKTITVTLTWKVKLEPLALMEGDPRPVIESSARARLHLAGVRVVHECPALTGGLVANPSITYPPGVRDA